MTVLVTGAAGAIGHACVERFRAAGEQVIAQDLDASAWADTEGVIVVSGNLLADGCLTDLQGAASEHGLRAVVAAHGVAGSAVLSDCSPEFVARVLAVNATTIPMLYASVESYLRESHGAFVAVASQAALTGEAGNTAYCAAKFAVLGWVKAMTASNTEVSFHALCPGATMSPLLIAAQKQFAAAEGISPEEYFDERARQIAVGRYGEPSEIAAAANYLTGAHTKPLVLAVTGGDVLY